jgi:hydroxylysine kinase
MSTSAVDHLAQAPPAVTDEQALAIAEEWFALSAQAVRPLPGERDRNFLLRDAGGEEFVLKVVHPAEDPAVTDFQTCALRHVAAADPSLPVPRVVAPRSEEALWQPAGAPPCRVRCVTYLPGRPLHGTAATPSQRRSLGAFLARLDLALAGFEHPADDHDLLWDLKRAGEARGLPGAAPDALPARVLDRFALEVVPRLAALRGQVSTTTSTRTTCWCPPRRPTRSPA